MKSLGENLHHNNKITDIEKDCSLITLNVTVGFNSPIKRHKLKTGIENNAHLSAVSKKYSSQSRISGC